MKSKLGIFPSILIKLRSDQFTEKHIFVLPAECPATLRRFLGRFVEDLSRTATNVLWEFNQSRGEVDREESEMDSFVSVTSRIYIDYSDGDRGTIFDPINNFFLAAPIPPVTDCAIPGARSDLNSGWNVEFLVLYCNELHKLGWGKLYIIFWYMT